MSSEAVKRENQWFGLNASTAWTVFLSFVAGLGVAYFTQWIGSKEPHLFKTVSEVVPFKGEKGEVGIVNIRITNDGNKEAEDLEGRIEIPGASIEEIKVVPEIVHPEKVVKNDALEVKFKLLNPNNWVQISALVRKPSELPAKPVVTFRGKGVTADETPLRTTSQTALNLANYSLAIAAISMLINAMSVAWVAYTNRKHNSPIFSNYEKKEIRT